MQGSEGVDNDEDESTSKTVFLKDVTAGVIRECLAASCSQGVGTSSHQRKCTPKEYEQSSVGLWYEIIEMAKTS